MEKVIKMNLGIGMNMLFPEPVTIVIESFEERYEKYEEFWLVIGDVLPFQEWIDAWNSSSMQGDKISSRATWIKELWRIRCAMEKNLELVNREKFRSLCKRIRAHRSGCGKKPRARTCRKGASANKTRKLTAVLIRED